jgi:hypothetical protein
VILSLGQNENVCRARRSYDVTVFVVRVISTYVTFYHTVFEKSIGMNLRVAVHEDNQLQFKDGQSR